MWLVTKSNRNDILVGDYLEMCDDGSIDVFRIQDGVLTYVDETFDISNIYTKLLPQYKLPFDPCDTELIGNECIVQGTTTNMIGKIVSIVKHTHGDIKSGDWLVRVSCYKDLFVVPGSKDRLV